MQMRKIAIISVVLASVALAFSAAAQVAPATQPGVGRLPHVTVDVARKQVRVECEALRCEAPLEFFCVLAGTSEHESVIRTRAKPSDIHTGLLMIGLTPGEPLKYSKAANKQFPPHGPPINITMEFEKNGARVSLPAYKLMRDIRTKQPMPATSWIFAGSRVMDDGNYAANLTGYVVSIVNFELTLMDVPKLASNANETLEWEAVLDLLPPLHSPMTMVIEPAGAPTTVPTTSPSSMAPPLMAPASVATVANLSEVKIDQPKVDALRQRWEQDVRPHATALRNAAQAQYEVIASLRREQQRLIDEADRIQRLIDELERDYQQMTTPGPETK
jgi:hypothetical protein